MYLKDRIKHYIIIKKAGVTVLSWKEQRHWLNLDLLGQVHMQKKKKKESRT